MSIVNAAEKLFKICHIEDARRVGKDYVLRCCKNKDKDPSCRVHMDGYWNCFSCEGHGEAVDFLVYRLGISRREANAALNRVVNDVHLVDKILASILSTKKKGKKVPKREVHEYKLRETLLGEFSGQALVYLDNRKVSASLRKEFGIRFGVKGILKNRIVLPITYGGICVGATSRTLCKSKGKKYLWNKGFKKDYLYGYDQWEVGRWDEVVLVEGPFDVLRLHAANITSGLAVFSSRVSEGQIELLHKLGAHVLLVAFDNDKAGHRGYEKLVEDYGDEFEMVRWRFWETDQLANDIGDMKIRDIRRSYDVAGLDLTMIDKLVKEIG